MSQETICSDLMNLKTQHDSLLEWLPHRHQYLDEILALEAPPPTDTCFSCRAHEFTHRCTDCFGHPVFCRACCLDIHERNPYHAIQKWTGDCFIRDSLYNLGLVLHLGHGGQRCPSCKQGEDFKMDGETTRNRFKDNSDSEDDQHFQNDICIVHSSGIFRSRLQYCCCENSPDRHLQLLRLSLFPATLASPQTAFTFSVLDQFEIDTMECKTSAMSFFSKLRRQTNNAFPNQVPVSIKLFHDQ
jgi:CxC2 like cysteine cluster associated with KDZ transposases